MTPALLLVVLGLATYRLTRAVAVDAVTEGLRERVRNRWPDDPGRALVRYHRGGRWSTAKPAGRVRPHGPGYLIACPWCVGWWCAGALVAVMAWSVGLAAPLLAWPAVAAVAALLSVAEDRLTR